MKIIKFLGLICLICFTFIYTEKVIDVSINQDEIMIKLKEMQNTYKIEPLDATIEGDTIIPGSVGKKIDIEKSYKQMKQIGYFEESLITYENIYIINNNKTIYNILNIISNKNVTISFFIDSSFLNNNLEILPTIKNYEIYNYGNNGIYTKDNLIITNNIINNKTNNNSIYCLFLIKNIDSLNTCSNNKMLSIIPTITGNYNNIKNNLENGSIIHITNTQELSNIIDYIKNKGYNIVPLSNIIQE